MPFLIAIVGRPNVGKSTLFNRLTRARDAIVNKTAGVTRDRHYGAVRYAGARGWVVIDTGGFESDVEGPIVGGIIEQAQAAIEEADLIICLLGSDEGALADDHKLVESLRKQPTPVIYVANKVDVATHEQRANELYELGITDLVMISAEHDRGLSGLVDTIAEYAPEEDEEGYDDRFDDDDFDASGLDDDDSFGDEDDYPDDEPGDTDDEHDADGDSDDEDDEPAADVDTGKPRRRPRRYQGRIAVIGRPNTGKSTLVNRILGYNRTIASPLAGTTRDSVDAEIERDGKRFLLVDTAGIRRRARTSGMLEKITVLKALKALERCELALLMLDAQEGVTDQDKTIARHAQERGRALMVLINKWDLVEKTTGTYEDYVKDVFEKLHFTDYAPVITISALSGQRVARIWETAEKVLENHRRRIPTAKLNEFVEQALSKHKIPNFKHRRVKVYYATQVAVGPPRFVLFTNIPDGITRNYLRYLEGQLRQEYNLEGTPIVIRVRKRR